MLWLGWFVSIWNRHFRAESRVSIPFLWKGEGCICPYLCHPVRWRYATEFDGKRKQLNGHLFSWMIYFWRCHPAQVLKILNNLECFTAGLNSSFDLLALWSVPHAWLPWARCAVYNDLVHKSCPSNVTEAKYRGMTSSAKATQIILVSIAFIICKDESHLTKKWAVKCVLQGICLYTHEIGKYWILGGAYLFCQVPKEEKCSQLNRKQKIKWQASVFRLF